MNVQEQEQLARFLQELALARVGVKDAEAEKLIVESCSRQPDASYLLVQRNLLLEQALRNLEAENSRLKRELEGASGVAGNFLNINSWGNSAVASAVPPPALRSAPPPPVAAVPASNSSWGGAGILGTVATTAAGVVAGSFLFQGIEHLMGGHGGVAGSSVAHNSPLMTDPSTVNAVSDSSDYSSDTSSDFDSLVPSDGDLDSV
ncbi:MAG: DUF2076 domain-containing protein [Betaproteobacteria bacterium]